ncbi:helix-turn-helix transcriptional regulator [Allopusillimonas ginsengisoli]|uniref:S24 family peptidase n=1 Tax=Allopusillimonas ginsengisoli TaxID=453575 RepID=UPI0039C28AD2
MNDVVSIRRENLAALVSEFGLTSVSKRVKRSVTQINDMVAGRKSFGEKVARSMEAEWDASLLPGWLDEPKNDAGRETPKRTNLPCSDLKPKDSVLIPKYQADGPLADSFELPDQPGTIQSWQVDSEWLERNVRAPSDACNLCIVTGFGDSMQPLFNPGDPLLVDTGVASVDFDSIYFFRIGTEGFVKRLQRIPTESGLVIRAMSENRDGYDAFDITERMDFHVLGRVVKVWCSRDF